MPSPTPAAVLTLSREEMRSRALAFAKRWKGPQREEADAKSFLDEFFDVFGRDRRAIDAVHEYRVERPDQGEGRIDLLWPGKLLVEMKSTGRDLSDQKGGAARQAFDYLPHLDPELRPRWVLVSDFGRFALYDLGEEVHASCEVKATLKPASLSTIRTTRHRRSIWTRSAPTPSNPAYGANAKP